MMFEGQSVEAVSDLPGVVWAIMDGTLRLAVGLHPGASTNEQYLLMSGPFFSGYMGYIIWSSVPFSWTGHRCINSVFSS